MPSLKKVIYTLGNYGKPIYMRDLVTMMHGLTNFKINCDSVSGMISHRSYFFKKERGEHKFGEAYVTYTLSKSGWRFYNNIKDIYDPVTDTLLLPQSQDKYKNEYKVPEGYKLVKIEE